MGRRRHSSLRSSKQDLEAVRHSPSTPQTQASAYRLAFSDEEFLTSEDLRGVRFQLEYLKPEMRLRESGINSTVVLFGGARIPEPGKPAWAAKTEIAKKNLEANSRILRRGAPVRPARVKDVKGVSSIANMWW